MPSGTGLRGLASRALMRVRHGAPPSPDGRFARSVSWDQEGSKVVREQLAAGGPCLVARIGSTELACISFRERWRRGQLLRLPYPAAVRRIEWVNSGIFPTDDRSLDRFTEVYLDAVTRTDVMGVWFNRSEDRLIERYCPGAKLVQLEALNPVLHDEPWSAVLVGKTVLVVHPFARTIESQYRTRRTLLFDNPDVLPDFELKTLVAVQSIAGNDAGYRSWFDALASMRERIAAIDFDVAIIGAGAYGLPLGATVKDLGRQAVILGGATQLLFGVRGRRWEVESPDDVAPLFNEHWVRPSADETPEGAASVEGGCYW